MVSYVTEINTKIKIKKSHYYSTDRLLLMKLLIKDVLYQK
jgi:hypothetical protein